MEPGKGKTYCFCDHTTQKSDGSDEMIIKFNIADVEFIKQRKHGLIVVLKNNQEHHFGIECSISFYADKLFIG